MPIANKYSIAELMEACDYYFARTGRRISFEYSLVGGVNDTKEDAEGLIGLAGKRNCHINLIPVNPIKERDYVQSEKKPLWHLRAGWKKPYQCNRPPGNGTGYRWRLRTASEKENAGKERTAVSLDTGDKGILYLSFFFIVLLCIVLSFFIRI